MSRNFLQSLKCSLIPIRRLLCRIQRLVGQRRSANSSLFLLEVKYQNGMFQRFVLREQDLKLLEVGQADHNHWRICLDSPVIPLDDPQGENLLQSNAMISSVKLRRLLSSEEFDALLSSRFLT